MQRRRRFSHFLKFINGTLILLLNVALLAIAWIIPSLFWCSWLAIGLLLFLVKDASPRRAAGRAYVTFMFALAMAFWWTPDALEYSMGCSWAISLPLAIGLLLVEAAQIGVIFWLARWIQTRANISSWLMLAPIWVAFEFFWPKICPWLLGYSQIEFLPLIQIADITGAYGVSFLVILLGVLVCQISVIINSRFAKLKIPGFVTRDAIACFVVISASLIYGVIRMNQYQIQDANSTNYRVALLQEDVVYMQAIPRLQEMTAELQDQELDLVIWPETSFACYDRSLTDFSDEEKVWEYSRGLDRGLRPNQNSRFQMLGAGNSFETAASGEESMFVTAFLFDEHEQLLDRYDKRVLMPIGEYVPGQKVFPELKEWFAVEEEFNRGTDSRPLIDKNGIRIGTMICYEDMNLCLAREATQKGADILVCLINGSSFEHDLALLQHKALALMRTVECRRYLIRCGATGQTCVISPTGHEECALPLQVEGKLIHNLRLPNQQIRSIYVQIGDVFAWLCVACSCILLVISATRPKPA